MIMSLQHRTEAIEQKINPSCDTIKVALSLLIPNPMQWRIQDFPEGGREPSSGGVNTPNFPENCMKSKESSLTQWLLRLDLEGLVLIYLSVRLMRCFVYVGIRFLRSAAGHCIIVWVLV